MLWKEHIETAVASANARERQRRVDYHRYLVESGRDGGTSLEAHIERYADYAKVAPPASDSDIAALGDISPLPLPSDLIDFYRSAGGFRGGYRFAEAHIPSPAELLAAHRSSAHAEHLRSMGLTDMIRSSWGNDLPEFEHGSLSRLNKTHVVIGWRILDLGEAREYLYFDGSGRFDILMYHQDDFGLLHEDHLQPMIGGRIATLSFRDALDRWLVPVQFDDER